VSEIYEPDFAEQTFTKAYDGITDEMVKTISSRDLRTMYQSMGEMIEKAPRGSDLSCSLHLASGRVMIELAKRRGQR
jgi:hypothetical protein